MTRLVSNPMFPYYNHGWSLISEICMIFHVWNKISHTISWTIFIWSWNFLKLDSWKYKVQSAHEIKKFWAVQFLNFFCSSETSPPKIQTAPHKFFLDWLGRPPSPFHSFRLLSLLFLWLDASLNLERGPFIQTFKLPSRLIFSHIESKLRGFEFKFHVFFISTFINDVDLKPSYSNESRTIKS
jgi:hypothetical protein